MGEENQVFILVLSEMWIHDIMHPFFVLGLYFHCFRAYLIAIIVCGIAMRWYSFRIVCMFFVQCWEIKSYYYDKSCISYFHVENSALAETEIDI